MTSPSRFEQVENIFFEAAELRPDERGIYLDRVCADDSELRAEVESLLAHDSQGETRFANLVGSVAADVDRADAAEARTHVGPWRLVRPLGSGGMGTVWLAVRDDDEFRRDVAVKFLKRQVAGAWALRRFRNERQILAGLQHPNIASFYDGGTTGDGQPYIVMEYVEGPAITAYCRDRLLPVADRIRLFQKVCSAVGFAHRNLIIHRDLKPSNILVHHDGEPKLLDFGIAKLTDPAAADVGLTQTGLRILTPEYASPEQVRGGAVTTVTDVYALGLILYEILTGERAQRVLGASPLELDKAICETTPRLPSTAALGDSDGRPVSSVLKGDLDNIVLKAIRKEPERRYAGVAQLSDDLERYLQGRPITARRDTFFYRTGKLLLRNRLLSATAALAVLSLIGGLTVALYQGAEARRQADRAERRFAQVRKLANTFLFDFHDAIRDLPGATPARQMVANTALSYLDSLAADAASNADLSRELIEAYEKVGDVQGLPGSSNLGKLKDAQASYNRALSIANHLPPDDIRQSRLLLRLGMLEAVAGNSSKAIELEQRAADFAAQADRATPSSRTRRQNIAVTAQLGPLLVAAGRSADGLKTLLGGLAAEEKESTGTDAASLLRLATAHSAVTGALKMNGDRARTIFHSKRAQEFAERSLVLDPTNARTQFLLITINKDRADAISSPFTKPEIDREGALVCYRAAQAIAENLLKNDPNNQTAAFQSVITRASVADLLMEPNPSAALRELDKALLDWKRLSHLNVDNLTAERMLMNIYLVRGRIQTSLGAVREAEEAFDNALKLTARFYARDPKRLALSTDRMSIHSFRGILRAKTAKRNLAETDFAECRKIAATLSPSATRARELREAAYCYQHSGDLAASANKPVAQEHYRAALDKWSAIVARGNQSQYLDTQIAAVSAKLKRSGGAQ